MFLMILKTYILFPLFCLGAGYLIAQLHIEFFRQIYHLLTMHKQKDKNKSKKDKKD